MIFVDITNTGIILKFIQQRRIIVNWTYENILCQSQSVNIRKFYWMSCWLSRSRTGSMYYFKYWWRGRVYKAMSIDYNSRWRSTKPVREVSCREAYRATCFHGDWLKYKYVENNSAFWSLTVLYWRCLGFSLIPLLTKAKKCRGKSHHMLTSCCLQIRTLLGNRVVCHAFRKGQIVIGSTESRRYLDDIS